jgi:hypothetical protein
LRWLTGKRSSEENWDAFEALTGRPLLELCKNSQPWGEVRFWLHDLAVEIQSSEKDDTLPELGLDRIWLTGEGRVKLLDFPAPGLAAQTAGPNRPADSRTQRASRFLAEVAAAALAGTSAPITQPGDVPLPLPLHARAFLSGLSQLPSAHAVAAALKPLLDRAAAVSRLRRGALVAGCMVFPLLALGSAFFVRSALQEANRKNPELMHLSSLLELRTSARFRGDKRVHVPSDHQLAIYIVHHYRGLLTNQATWSNPLVLSVINGERRAFVEKSLAEHPGPTEAQIADADAAVDKIPRQEVLAANPSRWVRPAMAMYGTLLACVCLPALMAALAFRGGLVLLLAGVTFVRNDGQRASRLRLLWRALLTWGPSFFACVFSMQALDQQSIWGPWVGLGLVGLLAAWSVLLPGRGLQDYFAGTWPVPR